MRDEGSASEIATVETAIVTHPTACVLKMVALGRKRPSLYRKSHKDGCDMTTIPAPMTATLTTIAKRVVMEKEGNGAPQRVDQNRSLQLALRKVVKLGKLLAKML